MKVTDSMILLEPFGPYTVGTEIFNWVDKERIEVFAGDNKTHRKLVVQLWYPTKEIGKFRPYAHEFLDLWKEGLKKTGFPETDIDQIEFIKSYEILNAPLSKQQAPYPVIFFSHGYASHRFAYSSFVQELASHGYIVVGIGHTYYTHSSKFQDGTIIYADPECTSLNNLIEESSSQQQQNTWVQDVNFVFSQLQALNKTEKFLNSFDFSAIGAAGHSFGGSTAIQLARSQDYIKAAVNLDGALFGAHAAEGFNKPIMFLVGEKTIEQFRKYSNTQLADMKKTEKLMATLRQKFIDYIPELIKTMQAPVYYLEIVNADHGAFSDWVLLKDLPLYKNNKALYNMELETGNVDGSETIKKINSYIVAFFNTHLKNKKEIILNDIRV
jgi:dienelactone hydrolase